MVDEVVVDSRNSQTWQIGLPFARMDILGFSDLMRNLPLQNQLIKLKLLNVQLHFAEQSGTLQPPTCQFWGDELFIYPHKGYPEEYNLYSMVHFLSELMHDSVVSFLNRVEPLLKGLPLNQDADQYVPLRGGLSFGDLYVEKYYQYPGFPISTDFSVTIEDSIIKAYEWERAQKWVGASIDPESLKQLEGAAPQIIEDLKEKHYLIEWNIPTNTGLIKSLAINFVREGEESFKDIMALLPSEWVKSE
jgi:hypothetical protein